MTSARGYGGPGGNGGNSGAVNSTGQVTGTSSTITGCPAGTGGNGVYRSTDSGVHWNGCTNTALANQKVLSLIASSSGALLAGTENGVYTSTDCDTWTAQNTGLP